MELTINTLTPWQHHLLTEAGVVFATVYTGARKPVRVDLTPAVGRRDLERPELWAVAELVAQRGNVFTLPVGTSIDRVRDALQVRIDAGQGTPPAPPVSSATSDAPVDSGGDDWYPEGRPAHIAPWE